MDDATRERWAEAVAKAGYDYQSKGLGPMIGETLHQIAVFLRSDECPRDGDIILRPTKNGDEDYAERFYRRIDVGGSP